MDSFKKYISWYTTSYQDEDYFIRRKAEYMVSLMHYLILAVSIITVLEFLFVEFSLYALISGIVALLFFGIILLLLKKKHLNSAINLLIVSGFMRLLMIYFYPTPYQFYVMSLVNILIIAVIHTNKKQIQVKIVGILILMIAKTPVMYYLVNNGELHWRAVTESMYATILFIIFIQMTNFLINIINDEINKTVLLQESAYTDHLSGLKNRRYFWEIQSESETLNGIYSIILLDVDHFKRINDMMGHNTGDHVLNALADILKKQIGEKGFVFRWGGEEFLILLPHSEKGYGMKLSEKIRRSIEKTTMLDNINVTVSIGVEDSQDVESIEDVIARADQAMYKAKKTGRNKVCELTA